MKVLHKKGWLLRIVTFAGDSGDYQTYNFPVDNETRVAQLVEFANYFGPNPSNCIGNIYQPNAREKLLVLETFEKFDSKYPEFMNIPKEKRGKDTLHDFFMEVASDIGLAGGYTYTKLVDEIQVLYFSEDILFEDVTSKFE